MPWSNIGRGGDPPPAEAGVGAVAMRDKRFFGDAVTHSFGLEGVPTLKPVALGQTRVGISRLSIGAAQAGMSLTIPPEDTFIASVPLTALAHREPAPSVDPRVPLLLVLSITTGVVDAASVLGLGKVFTANMTGNIVFLGFAVAGARGFRASVFITAILSFLIGAVLAGRTAKAFKNAPQRRWLLTAAAIETVERRGDSPRRRHRSADSGESALLRHCVDRPRHGIAQRDDPRSQDRRSHDHRAM